MLSMFKVNNKDIRTTTLAFRIFDSIKHQPFRVQSKICVSGKVGDIVEESYKNLNREARF